MGCPDALRLDEDGTVDGRRVLERVDHVLREGLGGGLGVQVLAGLNEGRDLGDGFERGGGGLPGVVRLLLEEGGEDSGEDSEGVVARGQVGDGALAAGEDVRGHDLEHEGAGLGGGD